MREQFGDARAVDPEASTEALFAAALEEVRHDDVNGPTPNLVALHERNTRHVLDTAIELVDDPDPVKRELGLRVVRELLTGADRHSPWRDIVLPTLTRRLAEEENPDVLSWVVSALGYHRAHEVLGDVIPLAQHEHHRVRFHVAAALPGLVDHSAPDDTAITTLQNLCADEDADTRYYALHALVEEGLAVPTSRIHRTLERLVGDPDEQVRSLATEALSR